MSIKDAAQAVMKKAVQAAPDGWMPGGTPDPLIRQKHGLIGKPVSRLDGPQKVSGTARFAAEFPMENMVYAALKYSTVAKGRIKELDSAAAEVAPGVVLVMTYRNAPRMRVFEEHQAEHEPRTGSAHPEYRQRPACKPAYWIGLQPFAHIPLQRPSSRLWTE